MPRIGKGNKECTTSEDFSPCALSPFSHLFTHDLVKSQNSGFSFLKTEVSKKTINVSITKDLEYFVEKEKVPFEQLLPRIQAYQKASPDLTVILFADRTIAIENVVNLTDIANQLKIKLVLATETKK